MNSSVAKLIRKTAGGTGKYYRQLKKAYKNMSRIDKEKYVAQAKAILSSVT